MESLLVETAPIKADAMAPDVVRAQVEAMAQRLASEHGGRPADFAWGAYTTAYKTLWARFVEMQNLVIPFLADEDCDGKAVLS